MGGRDYLHILHKYFCILFMVLYVVEVQCGMKRGRSKNRKTKQKKEKGKMEEEKGKQGKRKIKDKVIS